MEGIEGFNAVWGGIMGWTTVLSTVLSALYLAIPVLIVWMIVRYFKNKTDKRAQIVQAIIEKNPDAGNVEELMRQIAPRQKSLKEKLLEKLLWGSVFVVLGICFLSYALFFDYKGGMEAKTLHGTYLVAFVLLGVGIVLFLNYFISKKMLAKEIEAEENSIVHSA